ncbi:MAG: hypothetical protein WCK79_03275 [Actinomycetes bacterium]
MRVLRKRSSFWRDDRGVAESTLVIIPLMVLFLITAELIVAVNYRNLDLSYAQSEATTGAITGQVLDTDEVVSFDAGWFSLDRLKVLITHHQRSLPRILPAMPFLANEKDRVVDVVGIAVMEKLP